MADPGTPGWMAPTVIISGVVSAINFGWNLYNLRRSNRIRQLDHDKGVFSTQVVAPVEASLTKFEEFVMSLRTLDRQHARLSADEEAARIASYEELQRETFEPAMAQFQLTLRRVAAMKPTLGETDWLTFEDCLDPVRTSFDTLCRHGCEHERLKAASGDVQRAVQMLCANLRARMNEIARSLATL